MTKRRTWGRSYGTAYAGGDWLERAACGTASLEEQNVMTGGSGQNGQNIKPAREAARKFCDNCPVRTECFDWASNEVAFYGVAAGFLFGFKDGQHFRPYGRRLVKL